MAAKEGKGGYGLKYWFIKLKAFVDTTGAFNYHKELLAEL
jgi:hypothetical protein